ncbi:MAG TPA: HNH endonuclease signature motif containing protein [Steroidobacteraceae bacterium]|nr:HNH endonuclease signature motif containing protein [Steroidobacteraceae bacterium]
MPLRPPVHRPFVSQPREAWVKSPNASPRLITGRKLQRERERLFREHPLCAICIAAGRVRAATIRDHIKALAEGGQDVEENTQGLCQGCSDTKTKGESRRGRSQNSKDDWK